MKKLAEKLKKVDLELSKWTREVLFEHLVEVCQDIEHQGKFKWVKRHFNFPIPISFKEL